MQFSTPLLDCVSKKTRGVSLNHILSIRPSRIQKGETSPRLVATPPSHTTVLLISGFSRKVQLQQVANRGLTMLRVIASSVWVINRMKSEHVKMWYNVRHLHWRHICK